MSTNGLIKRDPTGRRAALIRQLEDASATEPESLPLASTMTWFCRDLGGVPRGAAILLSGDPGLGKTTLALQIASAAATLSQTVLYIATEQSAEALTRRLLQISRCPRVRHYLQIKDDLYDLRVLPALLSHQLLNPASPLHGTCLVIIDSLQGCAGLSSSDHGAWTAILEFMRRASAARITVLALAHRTKGGAIAGPRTLEHSCDVTLLMKRGVACRSIEVMKNRFGPSSSDPLPLRLNPATTCLEPAPIGHGATATVKTLGSEEIVSIEAAIVPARGDRGFVKCPGMNAREVETLADTLERCWKPARSMFAMGVTVRAPAEFCQNRDHSLAIVAVMMCALLRARMPEDTIVLGDLGLDSRALPASGDTLNRLKDLVESGALEGIRRVATPPSCVLNEISAPGIEFARIQSIDDLARLMEDTDGSR